MRAIVSSIVLSSARVIATAPCSELVDVRVAGFPFGPAGGGEDVGELLRALADIDSELSTLFARGLVVDERTVDRPMDLL